MLSYCIFEKKCWGKGIASQAVSLFLKDIIPRFSLQSIGAFTYADNMVSICVLENNGFTAQESFVVDGRETIYLEYHVQDMG